MQIPMESLRLAVGLLPKAIFDYIALGAIGAPLIAVLLELTGKASKKIFYDKLAQQIASMSLILFAVFIIATGGTLAYVAHTWKWTLDWLKNPESPMMIVYASLIISAVFLIAYKYSWKKLKKQKAFHILLGIIAVLGGVSFIHSGTMTMRLVFGLVGSNPEPTVPDIPVLDHLLVVPGPTVMALGALYVIMAFTFAGSAGGLYLVLRRNKDNFGRDYYKFALPVISRWGLFPMIVQLISIGWLLSYFVTPSLDTLMQNTGMLVTIGGAAVLNIICCAIWAVAWKSATPMRHKIGLAAAPILVILAHSLIMAGAFSIFVKL
ncbi:hypothetical protein [Maridesulfovibrio bastinii]|uniref:hypothetical protein n=1 Tax=Maridesulfovibrio bastinii TaxID=47157 RepID=UPI0003FDC379|nr:hypothetical protein [Maridesulfovibrio bastinii]